MKKKNIFMKTAFFKNIHLNIKMNKKNNKKK